MIILVTTHYSQLMQGPKHQTSPISKNKLGIESKSVKFAEIEDTLMTGDLALLYRGDNQIPHYAVFIRYSGCDSNFPLLLLKGKTKPLPLEKFDPNVSRDAHTVSATTRIFYGDYHKVAIRRLQMTHEFNCQEMMNLVNRLSEIQFTSKEIKAIRESATPEERSAVLCTFMVAHFYKNIGELDVEPDTVTPQSLTDMLSLTKHAYIKLPKVKEGPVASGDPPFLTKLV